MRPSFTYTFLISIALFVIPFSVHAAGWINQSGRITDALYDIEMININNGYIVGANGKVYRTVNSGSTWSNVSPPGLTADLQAIDFIGDALWAVGDRGTRVMSRDGGATWPTVQTSSSPIPPTYHDIEITSGGVGNEGGYIAGESLGTGLILNTVNGGTSWTSMTLPGGTPPLRSVSCASGTTTCWAVGNGGTILKYTPSTGWVSQISNTTQDLYKIVARTNTFAIVVGNGGVVHITQNGTSWSNPISGRSTVPTSPALRDIQVSGTTYYVTGTGGAVYQSTDSGAQWIAISPATGVITTLNAVNFVSATAGWVVGASGVIKRFDNTAPSVPTNLTRISTTDDTTPSFSWTAVTDDSQGIVQYEIRLDGVLQETQLTNTTTITPALIVGSSHTLAVRAKDEVNNTGTDATLAFTITQPNRAPNLPTSLSQHDSTSTPALPAGSTNDDTTIVFKATLSDPDLDAVWLDLEVRPVGTAFTNGATNVGTEITSGSTATISVGSLTDGSYHWQARTADRNGARSAWVSFGGNAESVADFIISIPPPNVPPNPPTGLTERANVGGADQLVGFTDTDGIVVVRGVVTDPNPGDTVRLGIELQPVGTAFTGFSTHFSEFNVNGGTATITIPGLANNSYHWQARTNDSGAKSGWISFGGNAESAADFTVAIPPPITLDTTPPGAPSNLRVTSGTTDTTPNLVWDAATDNVGIASYDIQTDGGAWIAIGAGLTFTYGDALTVGSHTTTIRARDTTGNIGASTSLTFTITSGAGGEPTVGGGTSPPSGGNQPPVAGGGGTGIPPAIGAEPNTPAGLLPNGLAIGDLVKIADDGNPNTFVDTSVYYLGANGARYVFPNDKAYFSWYTDFSRVRIITVTQLAAVPLRGNVTYRPGVRMIKVQSAPTVYTVSRGGVLRAIPSEAVASALYGPSWNKVIDDISDAFWTNYREGAPLVNASDFNPSNESTGASTISLDKGL